MHRVILWYLPQVSWCYQSNAYVQLIGRLTKWVNKKSGKGHSEFYKLLQLLVAEQGFLHILLQEVESGNALVGDL
ncbi:hypothetical protein T4B_7335 [Trichinella pseudospiralis]|uniref:Uncharacterized protein n=1 Tax=Trichinella pseudospiralis TaxID=6337 RepID=A0A0V1E958_TRIPS|nr:hypothetical protein T4A_1833 [Trichinella pseudospiralis]KRY70383.1 hypothetical protein T4A_12336 [Trichinella pseudospiralis]KRZ10101.1 hypothetical protein T4B_7335 [Trichinella pseudospiralis]